MDLKQIARWTNYLEAEGQYTLSLCLAELRQLGLTYHSGWLGNSKRKVKLENNNAPTVQGVMLAQALCEVAGLGCPSSLPACKRKLKQAARQAAPQ